MGKGAYMEQDTRRNDGMVSSLGPFSPEPFKPFNAHKARKGLKGQQGFTLVEILVAITLMLLGVFAVLGMQTVALQSNSIANQLSVATSLASEALEDISSSRWSSTGAAITNGTTTLTFGTSSTYTTYSTNQSVGLFTITCTPTLDSPISGIVQLDVTATYSYKGNTKRVTMTGYKRIV